MCLLVYLSVLFGSVKLTFYEILCCYKSPVITKWFLSSLHICTPENLVSFSTRLFTHAAKNRRIPTSETRGPEAVDGAMQTDRVLVGERMSLGSVGLFPRRSDLSSPQAGRDLLLKKCFFFPRLYFSVESSNRPKGTCDTFTHGTGNQQG